MGEMEYRSLMERLRIYDEVIRLRRAGLGYRRISKVLEAKYGISMNPGAICNWVRGRHNPLRRCNNIVEGPELAYVIGGWLGDGTLARERNNYKCYVKLSVKDYDFAEEWGRCLAKASGRLKPYVPRWENALGRWVVKGSNILLYNLLKRARENPRILLPYLEKYPAEACRGFFDAEGSVWRKRYQVRVHNTDPRVIELCKQLLEKIGIYCSVHKRRQSELFKCPKTGKRYHRNSEAVLDLAIYGRENILRFAEKVGFTIARKRLELTRLIMRYKGLNNLS